MSKQPFSQPLILEYYSTMQVPLGESPSFTYPSLNAIPREDKIVVRFSSVRPVTSYPLDVDDVSYPEPTPTPSPTCPTEGTLDNGAPILGERLVEWNVPNAETIRIYRQNSVEGTGELLLTTSSSSGSDSFADGGFAYFKLVASTEGCDDFELTSQIIYS